MIDTIMFDLDGTLLPMDQDAFVKAYMGLLAGKMAEHGYEPKKLVKTVLEGTGEMVANDGSRTNEQVFWSYFQQVYGEDVIRDEPLFESFYHTAFDRAKEGTCSAQPLSAPLVRGLKARGYRVILATNPIFPAIATRQRLSWTGLTPEDFDLVTTYENSRHCKPNPDYYRDLMDRFGLKPEQCMMVGNDVAEDMIAAELGMEVFLLTDFLLNKKDLPTDRYRQGSMEELAEYLNEYLK